MIDKAMIEYFWEMANRNPNHNTNWDDPVVIRFAELIAKYERNERAKMVPPTDELLAEYIRVRGES